MDRRGTQADARRVGWRGQAVVEFALVAPVLILLLLIAIDFGRAFFTYIQVSNAAREGAAYAAANPTDSAPGGGIWTHVTLERNAQGQVGENPPAVTVTCAAGAVGSPVPSPSPIPCADAPGGTGPGNTVTVTVSERFSFLTPFVNLFFGDAFTLRTSATAAVLGLAATGGTNPGGCTAGPSSAAFAYSIDGRTVTVDATGALPTTGLNAITGYNWDWGDGTDPYLQEGVILSHTYASLASYMVSLTVENPCGTLQSSQLIDLVPPTPSPGATPTPTPSPTIAPTPSPSPTIAPTPSPGVCTMRVDFTWVLDKKTSKVTFSGSATGQPNPAYWYWSFGSGQGSETTTSSTTSHNYPKPDKGEEDEYTVSLYGRNGACTSPTVSHTVVIEAKD